MVVTVDGDMPPEMRGGGGGRRRMNPASPLQETTAAGNSFTWEREKTPGKSLGLILSPETAGKLQERRRKARSRAAAGADAAADAAAAVEADAGEPEPLAPSGSANDFAETVKALVQALVNAKDDEAVGAALDAIDAAFEKIEQQYSCGDETVHDLDGFDTKVRSFSIDAAKLAEQHDALDAFSRACIECEMDLHLLAQANLGGDNTWQILACIRQILRPGTAKIWARAPAGERVLLHDETEKLTSLHVFPAMKQLVEILRAQPHSRFDVLWVLTGLLEKFEDDFDETHDPGPLLLEAFDFVLNADPVLWSLGGENAADELNFFAAVLTRFWPTAAKAVFDLPGVWDGPSALCLRHIDQIVATASKAMATFPRSMIAQEAAFEARAVAGMFTHALCLSERNRLPTRDKWVLNKDQGDIYEASCRTKRKRTR